MIPRHPETGAFFMLTNTEVEPSTPGTKAPALPSRNKLYGILAVHVEEAITLLLETMRTTRNDSIRIGAINTILNKCLPDLKAVELTGENQEPIKVRIVVDNGNRTTNTELPETASNIPASS